MIPAKNLTLRRNIYVTGKRTFGELYVEGSETPIAVTLEPEYNPAKATVSKSDTAIKAGRYRYTVQRSPKHGMSLRYKDVPCRITPKPKVKIVNGRRYHQIDPKATMAPPRKPGPKGPRKDK